MIYFPAFLNLEGQRVLICGANRHAVEKVQKMRPFHPNLTVIAPEMSEAMAAEPDLVREVRSFTEADARALPALVITAMDEAENRRIAALCRKYRVLVNAVDQQADCDFIFPALVTREPLCVAISSAGVSPSVTVEVKQQVEAFLPDHTEAILDWLGQVRGEVFAEITDSGLRRRVMRRLVQESFAQDAPLSPEETSRILAALTTE